MSGKRDQNIFCNIFCKTPVKTFWSLFLDTVKTIVDGKPSINMPPLKTLSVTLTFEPTTFISSVSCTWY